MKLTDAQRSHLEELLRDRPQWFKEKILADIAAEERRDDEDDTPRAGYISPSQSRRVAAVTRTSSGALTPLTDLASNALSSNERNA